MIVITCYGEDECFRIKRIILIFKVKNMFGLTFWTKYVQYMIVYVAWKMAKHIKLELAILWNNIYMFLQLFMVIDQ